MATILLADDHIMISKGLRKLLEIDFGFKHEDIYSVTSLSEIMAELKKKTYVILVLDLGLSDGSALEILPTVQSLYPTLRILIYSAKPTNIYQRALRQYGILHYLSKDANEERTMTILRRFLASDVGDLEDWEIGESPFSSLSPRELEVLEYLLKDLEPAEIADELNLRRTTVSEYRTRIFKKTQTTTVFELQKLADLYGLN